MCRAVNILLFYYIIFKYNEKERQLMTPRSSACSCILGRLSLSFQFTFSFLFHFWLLFTLALLLFPYSQESISRSSSMSGEWYLLVC